jgi:hypothetical protein
VKLGDRLVEKGPLAAIQREQEHREGAEEGVRQREIEALEEEVLSVALRRVVSDGLGEALLEERCNSRVRSSAIQAEGVHACAQLVDVSAHQQRERLFDRGEILLGGHDRKEGIGAGRQVREMIAGRRHDEMEIAVCFVAVALGHDCFEGSRRLFKRDPCLVRVAIEFEEAQPQPKQAIGVAVEIEAELRREGGRAKGKNTVTPDHGARLASRDEPAAKACRCRVCDGGCDRVRGGWHRL